MLNYNFSEKDRASTSFTQHCIRTFKYKIFSNELPTLTRLRQRRPDIYHIDECLFCQRHSETQDHLWYCSSQQDQWRAILNRAADQLMSIIQQMVRRNLPTLEALQYLIHESRTFFTKGIVSTHFYWFIYSITQTTTLTKNIIAQVYNFIYAQIFTHIWKPRCAKVVEYEKMLGITNRDKRSKQRYRTFNYLSQVPSTQTKDDPGLDQLFPWVDWFTTSIW